MAEFFKFISKVLDFVLKLKKLNRNYNPVELGIPTLLGTSYLQLVAT